MGAAMSARDDYDIRSIWASDKLSDIIDMHHAMCDEIDGLRALAVDLWDEVMAWHLDDCPFPDSPMGTMDDQHLSRRHAHHLHA
jgi:hypothetical protein